MMVEAAGVEECLHQDPLGTQVMSRMTPRSYNQFHRAIAAVFEVFSMAYWRVSPLQVLMMNRWKKWSL